MSVRATPSEVAMLADDIVNEAIELLACRCGVDLLAAAVVLCSSSVSVLKMDSQDNAEIVAQHLEAMAAVMRGEAGARDRVIASVHRLDDARNARLAAIGVTHTNGGRA